MLDKLKGLILIEFSGLIILILNWIKLRKKRNL